MLCSFPFQQDLATKQALAWRIDYELCQLQRRSRSDTRHSTRGDVVTRAATRCAGGLRPGASGAEPGTLSWAGGGKGC